MLDEFGGDWNQVIPAYSARRVADGQAIADLALRNFLEMRDWVADPRFLLRKEIAAVLHERYPEFVPLYSMVTFSHAPYSRALAEAHAQDALFEDILNIEGIQTNWKENPQVDAIFSAWQARRN
jgi:kynurenine 3-monooxygenase